MHQEWELAHIMDTTKAESAKFVISKWGQLERLVTLLCRLLQVSRLDSKITVSRRPDLSSCIAHFYKTQGSDVQTLNL